MNSLQNSFSRGLEVIPVAKPSSCLVWDGFAPPGVETFYWLAALGKVSMTILRRRGFLLHNVSEMSLTSVVDAC